MRESAIVGVGTTPQGEFPGTTANQLAISAFLAALDDSGLARADIDGLITCRPHQTNYGGDTELGELLGLNPAYSATLTYGTCNFSLHLAAMAINAGLCTTVALLYGANQRTNKTDFTVTYAATDLGPPSGYLHISGPAAMALRRHQHLYGTTEEQFGQIAVGQRKWARLNPLAIFRDDLTLDQYLASPYLVEPLRRADVTMISDGGVAIIVTSADRATQLPHEPVHVRGMAEATALAGEPDQLMRPMMGRTAERLWANSRMSVTDVDVLYVQDPTAVWTLQALEHYGFCGIGEAGAFLEGGRTHPGGPLPTNTNGGQLSESYMWGWLHLVEATRQLRGECGDRQVEATTALYCSTMGFQKSAATLLSKEAA